MGDSGGRAVWPVPATRPFVGRAAPLATVERSLEEALRGRAGAVLIEGDAGIGKSRLAREAFDRARHAGALVLVGRCSEGVRVPYLPIATALAPLYEKLGDAARFLDLDVTAAEEPWSTLQDRPAAPIVAACRAVVRAARQRPVVVLIEDLHWADPQTADFFEGLVTTALDAGATDPTALLVAATLRTPRNHVVDVVERLRRDDAVRSVHIGGMDELELNELITSLGPARPSRELLAAMMDATAGNPLLTRTLVSRLCETGGVAVRDGELVSTAPRLALLPGGLDGELRMRLDQVGSDCRALLTTAAFLGDGGLLDDLAATTEADSSEFYRRVDEAESAGLLHDDGEHFRFDHPQICRVLFVAPEGRQRQRLHRRLADVLEMRYGDSHSRAIEIADHLRQAGSAVPRSRVARWCTIAGERAFAVAAWGAAARYLDAALAAEPPEDPRRRARLTLQSGLGHFRDHDLAVAEARLVAAITEAKSIPDDDVVTTAALLLTRARMTIGTDSIGGHIDTALLEEVLAASERDSRRAGEIVALLAEVRFHAFDLDGGMSLLEEARDIARRHADDELGTSVELAVGLQHLGRLELDAAAAAFWSSADHGRRLDDPWRRGWGIGRLPLVETIRGELSAAAGHADEAAAIAAANHDWAEHALASACAMQVAAARGTYGVAEAAGATAVQLYRRSDYAFVPALIYPAFAAIRSARGDVAGAHAALDDWAAVGGRGIAPYRLLVAASMLDNRSLTEGRQFRPVGGSPVNVFSLPILCAQAEVGAAIGDVALLKDAYQPLASAHRSGVRWSLGWPLLLSRLLAAADRCLGRLDDARAWCEVAVAEAGQAEAAGEVARITLERAFLAEALGDEPTARSLATEAAQAFDRLGMLPLLAPAHRVGGGPSGDGHLIRTILFTDLVGSTALNQRLGDAAYLELLERHNSILRKGLRRFDGVEIKHTGDGIGAWFASAHAACECALAIRSDLAEHNASNPDSPLRVRFGLAAGSPIPHEGDLFGITMSIAARLCDRAAPEQVLVSEDVAGSVESARLSFRNIGPQALKGFPEPMAVFDVSLRT